MNSKIEQGFKPRTWLMVILTIIALVITVILADKVLQETKEFSIFEFFSDTFDFNKSSFNSTLEMKKGSTSGFFVDFLIDDIITSNKKNSKHKITVVYNDISTQDENEIRKIKDNYNSSTEFEVVFDYDNKGYINKATLIQKTKKSDSFETKAFNSIFEMTSGSTSGFFLQSLLDAVILNNKSSEKIISVIYKDNKVTDENEIDKIKNEIEKLEDCNLKLGYDENGFVNQVTINVEDSNE